MKNLKKKFGKFAISQEKSAKINGGSIFPNADCKKKYFLPDGYDPCNGLGDGGPVNHG